VSTRTLSLPWIREQTATFPSWRGLMVLCAIKYDANITTMTSVQIPILTTTHPKKCRTFHIGFQRRNPLRPGKPLWWAEICAAVTGLDTEHSLILWLMLRPASQCSNLICSSLISGETSNPLGGSCSDKTSVGWPPTERNF
jgi:hypothetical protein